MKKRAQQTLRLSLATQTFKYWEIFLSWMFTYPSRCYQLDGKVPPQVFENTCDALYRLGQSYRAGAASKGIICQVTADPRDLDTSNKILTRIYHCIPNPLLSELATAEVLAKVVAYRELREGDRLTIPQTAKEGTMKKLQTYRVDRVFDLWNQLRAFGLCPIHRGNSPSILLFRGTDFSLRSQSGRASIISDLDPRGPGWAVFEKASPLLRQWLEQQANYATQLIGHSLGGAMLLYTLIQEHKRLRLPSTTYSYAFNFPGVSRDLAQAWNSLSPEERPPFKGIVCRGDLISKFGSLFGQVFEVSLPMLLTPIHAHERLLFAEPLCYLHPISIEEENQSSSRNFYSKMQQQTSSLIYQFGLKFLLP